MKFVFFSYDLHIEVLKTLLKDGHELLGLFSFECDNVFSFNKDIIKLSKKLNIPLTFEKPTEKDIQYFIDRGCEVFLSCGYPNKIPHIDKNKASGINFHPSLLPKGRGAMPTPYIIMNHPDAAGFSVHKLSDKFDAGDVLYQEAIKLTDKDTVDSYSAKIKSRAPEALSKIMNNFHHYLAKATPQNNSESSYFPRPNDAMRTINWDDPIKEIDSVLRGFGSFGSFANINGKIYVIQSHKIEEEKHDFASGIVIHASKNKLKVTALGGFITLTNFTALKK